MKENDIVTLINLKQEYKNKNLYLNANGIILKILPYGKLQILFFNDKILGDYAVINVDENDIKKQDFSLPLDFVNEMKNSNRLKEKNIYDKQKFQTLNFKECDKVELIVEDKKYTKYGLHKGDVGYIAIDYAVSNEVLVDFPDLDENNKYYGETFSININDLKVLK